MKVSTMIKKLVKNISRWLLGEYGIYRIYSLTVDQRLQIPLPFDDIEFTTLNKSEITASQDPLIASQAWYCGDQCRAYGLRQQGRLIALCFFWYGKRYQSRNFWPLQPGEAKLVQVITLTDMRGMGLATQLIDQAAAELFNEGFSQIFARIWHSNHPSIKAFTKAGWRPRVIVVDTYPLNRKKLWRVKLPIA